MQQNYNLTDEGGLNEYLGIKMERLKDGTRYLMQSTLIKRILTTVGMSEPRPPGKRIIQTTAWQCNLKEKNWFPGWTLIHKTKV